MHIIQARVINIRSLKQLYWKIDPKQAAGWHVIIGDNGSGKSSFVRAIALTLVGPLEASALRQDLNDWLRRGTSSGTIRLDLKFDSSYDKLSGSGKALQKYLVPVSVRLDKQQDQSVRISKNPIGYDPERYVWGGRSGWFSASYGPFRRFTGGDKDYEKIFYSNPKLASHLSVFDESVALTESLSWLRELQFQKLESLQRSERNPQGDLLDAVKAFVNQPGFLPYDAKLHEVSSKGVDFVDGNGCQISVEELSDGYRSILSMTFELLRQLAKTYGHSIFDKGRTQVIVPGVVLIDEVDAHLHPSWQRKVGVWFREHFPNIQFIVTTHSPLVCQAANVGTVWRLPSPGSMDVGGMVEGIELDRLLYGNILEAYSTEMFGDNITRSDAAKALLRRLSELNRKELHSSLTVQEVAEQDRLRAILPTTAHNLSNGAAKAAT